MCYLQRWKNEHFETNVNLRALHSFILQFYNCYIQSFILEGNLWKSWKRAFFLNIELRVRINKTSSNNHIFISKALFHGVLAPTGIFIRICRRRLRNFFPSGAPLVSATTKLAKAPLPSTTPRRSNSKDKIKETGSRKSGREGWLTQARFLEILSFPLLACNPRAGRRRLNWGLRMKESAGHSFTIATGASPPSDPPKINAAYICPRANDARRSTQSRNAGRIFERQRAKGSRQRRAIYPRTN